MNKASRVDKIILTSILAAIALVFVLFAMYFPKTFVNKFLTATSYQIPTEGLVAHWTFDDGTANDTSGNGNNGLINGAVTAIGKNGTMSALGFGSVAGNGSAVVTLPITNAISQWPNVTVSAWVKADSVSDDNFIYSSDLPGSGATVSFLRISNGQAQFWIHRGGEWQAASGATILSSGLWYHLVGTLDSTNGMNVYVNGVVDGHNSNNLPGDRESGTAEIGAFYYQSTYQKSFNGIIDEVAIYDRALTAQEISEIYSGQTSSGTSHTQEVITPSTGGIVALETTQVSIPADALSAPITVTVDQNTDTSGFTTSVPSQTPASDVYVFGPVGTTFATPVTITMNYTPADLSPVDIYLNVNGTWVPQGASCSNGICTLQTSHFSEYLVATIPVQPSLSCDSTITSDTKLTSDMICPGTAVTMGADNITLDCDGHAIIYSQSSAGTGVLSSGRSGVTIKNCRISQADASFMNDHGISMYSGTNNNILGNTINTNGDGSEGILLVGGSTNTIDGNTIVAMGNVASNTNQPAKGMFVAGSSNNTVTNNNVTTNGKYADGIYFEQNSLNNNVKNNKVNSSGLGIWISNGSNFYVANNSVSTNVPGAHGIIINGNSSDNTVDTNTINTFGDGAFGIYFWVGTHNTAVNNTIITNGTFGPGNQPANGVFVSGGVNHVITKNTVTTRGSGASGVYLEYDSNNNTVSNNTTVTSGTNANGVYIFRSSSNAIVDNNLSTTNNGANGVLFYGSSDNNITGNNIKTTGSGNANGIFVIYGSGNSAEKNIVDSSGSNCISISSAADTIVSNNNIVGSFMPKISSDIAVDVGENFWGRTSEPYFIPGVDSNTATVVDSSPKNKIIDFTAANLSAFNAAKQSAQSLIDMNAPESTTPGEHVIGSLAILIAANQAANATESSAQSIVDSQTATLKTAIVTYQNSIVPPSDISSLVSAKTSAQSIIDQNYSEGAVPGQHVVGSLAALQTVLNLSNATAASDQTTVDTQVAMLNAAIATYNAAIVPPSDMSVLIGVKATAQELIDSNLPESTTPGDHIVGSRAALQNALNATNATDASLQSVIDAQVIALNAAIAKYNAAIVPNAPITTRKQCIDAAIKVKSIAMQAARTELIDNTKKARESRITTINNAKITRENSLVSAKSTRDSALIIAKAIKNKAARAQAIKDANNTYVSTVKASNTVYSSAVKSANTTYKTLSASYNSDFQAAVKRIHTAYVTAIASCPKK